VPNYDRNRIERLEERLALDVEGSANDRVEALEMLLGLYLEADSYVPALETVERVLALPEVERLPFTRRAALESKRISCWLVRGDTLAVLARCRELLREEHAIESLAVRSLLHFQCGEALLVLGRLDEAQTRAENVLRLSEESGEISLAARSMNLLGRIAYRRGDLQRSRDLYEQALAFYRRLGDDQSAAWVRSNLGLVHKTLCEWDTAAAHLRESVATSRRLGRLADCWKPLLNLGVVQMKSGEWGRAHASFLEAERVLAQVGSAAGLAKVTLALGQLARMQERHGDAESLLLGALERARQHDLAREEALALEFLGELEFDRGHAESALGRYREATRCAERIARDGDLMIEVERRSAEALAALGRFDEAEAACEHARRLARASDDRFENAVTHRVAGTIAWARGRREDAVQAWTAAVTLLSECREKFELAKACLSLGRALEEAREARRHLCRATALFAELGAPSWLEQAESELRRLMGAEGHPTPATRSVFGRRHRAPSLVVCSPAMQRVDQLARRAAETELSVLVTGETGTGKELIARTIHSLSRRADRPFLAVNCGALRADLALSQLFGHRKGAFTGAHAEGVGLVEAANSGTLFLDEVGELPHDVQVTLLRFLESGEYLRLGETSVRRADVRIISATNRELRSSEGERAFRRDLLYRLNEIEIRLPALRERSEDVLPLARHFITFYGGPAAPAFSADADALLRAYEWPGNVRELENLMRRLAALHPNDEIDTAMLWALLSASRGTEPATEVLRTETRERSEILAAYEKAAGNKSRMAELLGVSRKTLYARLKRHSLDL
jgi:DNA-binding NtrC family response regulator